MPSALLIFNPNAGRFPAAESAGYAADLLRNKGWEITVVPTENAGHITTLAHQAAAEGMDALITAGGDGSLGRTLPGLIGTQTALAVLPTGTANVWAREIGLPKISPGSRTGIEKNIQLIADSVPVEIDIGTCNGTPFLLWAGIGLDAIVVGQAEQKRSHLKKYFVIPEYTVRALASASKWPGIWIDIEGNAGSSKKTIEYSGLIQLAIVTNIRRYAGGLATISQDALIDDGEMDLWVFTGNGMAGALRNAWNLLRGNHVLSKHAVRLPFSQANIRAKSPLPLHTDGDPAAGEKMVTFKVQKKALRTLLPKSAEFLLSP